MKNLIILSGQPLSGKSYTSTLLRQKLPIICIDVDEF